MIDYTGVETFFLVVLFVGIVGAVTNKEYPNVRRTGFAVALVALMCLATVRIVQREVQPTPHDLEQCKKVGTATFAVDKKDAHTYPVLMCPNGKIFLGNTDTK